MREYQVSFKGKCDTPLKKSVLAMDNEINIQHNKLLKLDNTMLMYGIYNVETLEKLINMAHEIRNVTSSHEKLFAGEHNLLYSSFYIQMLWSPAICIQFIILFENCTK